MNQVTEKPGYQIHYTLRKYVNEAAYLGDVPHEVLEFDRNVLLNEGITALLNLLTGAAETAFNNANSYIGVGDGSLSSLTGTVTFTNGSAAVTGSGTTFTSQVSDGDWIRSDADDIIVQVQTVNSDTSITLVSNYTGTGGAGAASVMAAAAAANTGLAGTSKAYVGMETSYPSIAAQTVTFRSVFGSAVGNFHWREVTVANGNSDAADNLNRKIQELGVKAAGATWTLDVAITWS